MMDLLLDPGLWMGQSRELFEAMGWSRVGREVTRVRSLLMNLLLLSRRVDYQITAPQVEVGVPSCLVSSTPIRQG